MNWYQCLHFPVLFKVESEILLQVAYSEMENDNIFICMNVDFVPFDKIMITIS